MFRLIRKEVSKDAKRKGSKSVRKVKIKTKTRKWVWNVIKTLTQKCNRTFQSIKLLGAHRCLRPPWPYVIFLNHTYLSYLSSGLSQNEQGLFLTFSQMVDDPWWCRKGHHCDNISTAICISRFWVWGAGVTPLFMIPCTYTMPLVFQFEWHWTSFNPSDWSDWGHLVAK